MKAATFKPKLRLPTRMPTLKAKPKIGKEIWNYKKLGSYASYGLRGLKMAFEALFPLFVAFFIGKM